MAIQIKPGNDQLVLGVIMPQELLNLSLAGLLGNANGNPDDDFQLPDGTVLSSDLSEEDIYYKFGEQCTYSVLYPSHADGVSSCPIKQRTNISQLISKTCTQIIIRLLINFIQGRYHLVRWILCSFMMSRKNQFRIILFLRTNFPLLMR